MLKMSVMFGLIVIFGLGLMIIGDEVGGPGSGNVGKVSFAFDYKLVEMN